MTDYGIPTTGSVVFNKDLVIYCVNIANFLSNYLTLNLSLDTSHASPGRTYTPTVEYILNMHEGEAALNVGSNNLIS